METSVSNCRSRFFWLILLLASAAGTLLAQLPLNVSNIVAQPGETVQIPILFGSGGPTYYLSSFGFDVFCDSTIMTLDTVIQSGTVSSGFSVIKNNRSGGFNHGVMRVGGYRADTVAATGVFIYIQGTAQQKIGISTVRLDNVFLNSGTPTPIVTNGSIRIDRRPSLPLLTDLTGAQGDSLFSIVAATDLDLPNDTLTFTMSNAPAGSNIAKLDPSRALFWWRPSFSQKDTFSVRVKVTDVGGLSDSTSLRIIVAKKNVKPTFINKMRDTTINQGQTLLFTYTASDPNGDLMSYSLFSPPSGATITTSGAFSWKPLYPVLGPTIVSAVVTDGSLQDVATATVTVARVNQKPAIKSFVPTATVFSISYNKPTLFAVSVSDPNGDPLTYKWVVNNVVVKSGADTFYTATFTDPHNTAKIVTAVYTDPDGLADSTMWFTTVTDVQTEKELVPTEYALGKNYPNPINPTTTLQFDLPKSSSVTLEVFNVSGARVRSLLRGENVGAGRHTMMWDGRDQSGRVAPSGVYMYRIAAGDFHAWKKMTLLK